MLYCIALYFLISAPSFLYTQTPEQIIDTVYALLISGADHEYIGEPISQLNHALQAAQHARLLNADDETVIAALLHDIGHLINVDAASMNGYGTVRHEQLGAQFLKKLGFSPKVCQLVAQHVNAKRYLVAKYSDYWNKLSEASRITLQWQGGPMSEEEIAAFEADPLFADILRIRQCDEEAKDPHALVAELALYKKLLLAHLKRP